MSDDRNNPSPCPIAPEKLISLMEVLVNKVDTLINLHRDIIRWMLIVICVIALGRSAFDVGREIFVKGIVAPAHAEK